MSQLPDEHDCEGCPLTGRRAFLRDSLAAVTGIAATLAIPDALLALPVSSTRAGVSQGTMRSYPIPPADGVQIDKEEDVILARWQNAVFAFALACPHQSAALRWQAGESRFVCPKHKSKYEPDGKYISGRATRSMDRFALRRDGGSVIVDLHALYQEDKNPGEWAAAVVRV